MSACVYEYMIELNFLNYFFEPAPLSFYLEIVLQVILKQVELAHICRFY